MIATHASTQPSNVLPPRATVLLNTRDRADRPVATVQSILANTHPQFELVVVDQSATDATAHALQPFMADARLRYIRSDTRGLSIGRNLGMGAARAEIVLITDDDCEVPPDWIERMAAAFAQHSGAAAVFCDVVADEYDTAAGWILVNHAPRSILISTLREWCAAGGANAGISAGMGVRRAAAQQVGGFDALLGAGGALRSGGETDLAIRLLLHGYQVCRTTATHVRHHGFRTHAQGRKLMRGYMFGIGAVYAKQIKCAGWRAVPMLLSEVWRTMLAPALHAVAHLRRPPVLGRVLFFWWGFASGLRAPLDAARQVYQASAAAAVVPAHGTWDEERAPRVGLLRRGR